MMQAEASRIMAEMEQRVSWLSSIANVAMLLGLLGTVTGMIGAFASVRAAGYSNPTVLSGGISEALISTAAGLVVAIPSLVAYHLFAHAIGRAATRMELAAADLLAYLAQAAPAAVRDRPAQRTSAQTQRGEKGPAQRRVVRKEGRTRRAP
jgi:biopolymer transport protein ExbB